jgi:hypothetical protein
MPTSKFNVGSKHKENSSMHAKTCLFLKTLLIQLKKRSKIKYQHKVKLLPEQAVGAHGVVKC